MVSKIYWNLKIPGPWGRFSPNLTSIFFQMGWNHQLLVASCFVCLSFFLFLETTPVWVLQIWKRCHGFLTTTAPKILQSFWHMGRGASQDTGSIPRHSSHYIVFFSPSFLRGELANFGGVFKIMPIAKIQGKHPQAISLDRAFHHWHAWCWNTSLMIDTSTE